MQTKQYELQPPSSTIFVISTFSRHFDSFYRFVFPFFFAPNTHSHADAELMSIIMKLICSVLAS